MIAKPTETSDAEICTIGSILLDPSQFDIVRGIISPRDFENDGLRKFYEIMLAMADAEKPVNDIVAITEKVRGTHTYELLGEAAGIVRLFEAVPHAAHLVYYARMVANQAALRRQRALIPQFIDRIETPGADANENRNWLEAQMAGAITPTTHEVKTAGQIARESLAAIEEDRRVGKKPGVLTGFYQFDLCFGSLMCAEMIIIAARPSMGKTALGLQIAEHAALIGKRAFVVSLEMRDRELIDRMMAKYAKIDGRKIRSRKLDDEHMRQLYKAADQIDEIKMSVWAPPVATIQQIRGMAKMEAAREPLSLIVVDYIGLVKNPDKNKEKHYHIADVSAALKQLAKELEIPVLVLCQVNRDAEGDRPTLAMLRDSGSIEQDADMVMFLHKERRDSQVAEWIVEKNRNGDVGKVDLIWHGESTTFSCPKTPKPNQAISNFNRD